MPLTALADGRRVVSVLLPDEQWEEVKDLARREPEKVLYPGSNRQVFCRTSTRGLRHFVSRHGQGETAPESAHHLMMKAHIARSLVKAGWRDVDVEVPFPEVDRIADVAATNPAGRRVVFEVQLSRQTRHDFRTRTEDYASCGATTIWVTPHVGRVPAGVSAIWTSVRVSDPSPTERTIASSAARLYRDGDLTFPKDHFDTPLNKVLHGQTKLSTCDTLVAVEEVVCAQCQQWFAWWIPTARTLPTTKGKTMFAPLGDTHHDVAQVRLIEQTLNEAYEKNLLWSPPAHPTATSVHGPDISFVCPHCQAHVGTHRELGRSRNIWRQELPLLYVRLPVAPRKGKAWTTTTPQPFPSVALERPDTRQVTLETPSIAKADVETTLAELADLPWPEKTGELEVIAADPAALDRDYYPLLQEARNRFVPKTRAQEPAPLTQVGAVGPSTLPPLPAPASPRSETDVFETLDKAVDAALSATGVQWLASDYRPRLHARFGTAYAPDVGKFGVKVLDHTPPEIVLLSGMNRTQPTLIIYVPDDAGREVQAQYLCAAQSPPPRAVIEMVERVRQHYGAVRDGVAPLR